MADLNPSLLDKNAYVEHLFNTAVKVGDLWSAQDALIFERRMQGLSEGKESKAQELVWKAYELLLLRQKVKLLRGLLK